MTFDAQPNIYNSNEAPCNPVEALDVDPSTLQGTELEAAFKAQAIQDQDLTPEQRLELHNKNYLVNLPE